MSDTVAIIILLVIAIILLIGCFLYLSYVKKQKEKYEKELLSQVRNKTKEMNSDTNSYVSEPVRKEPTTEVSNRRQEQVNLEALLEKMQQDLEGQNAHKVVDFEQEQEETSIISYKELKKAVEDFTEDEEKAQEQSPISVQEVLSLKEAHDEEIQKQEDPILSLLQETKPSPVVSNIEKESTSGTKKFHNTEFISPIYGKQEQKSDYPHIPVYQEQEEVLNVLDTEEDQHNEKFLNELKDFRNQL